MVSDRKQSEPPANEGEGADPARDVRKQNPGGTTTQDLTEGKKEPEDRA